MILSVGAGTTFTGGDVVVKAGATTFATAGTGGRISISSGYGTSTSSGSIVVQSMDAGTKGVSGHLSFATGTSSSGSSGTISISTGAVAGGTSGDIKLSIGNSGGKISMMGPIEYLSSVQLNKMYKGTVSLSTDINSGDIHDEDITISGVAEGDFVMVTPQTDAAAGSGTGCVIWSAWARSGGVTVRFRSVCSSQFTANGTWRIIVYSFDF